MIQGSGFRIWGLLLVPGSGLGGFVWVLGLGIVLGSGIGGCSGFGGCTPTVTTARATDDRLNATQGAGCRVQGAGCRVQGAGCRVQGAGCRVQGAGCTVQGAGCRVQGLTYPDSDDRACDRREAVLDHTHHR